jgi:hypothetical protein
MIFMARKVNYLTYIININFLPNMHKVAKLKKIYIMEIIVYMGKKWGERGDQWTRSHTFDQPKINIIRLIEG